MKEILIYGDKILREKAKKIPLSKIPSYKPIADEMFETMYTSEGIGLAAEQIGLADQIIVIDIKDPDVDKIVLINPEIISSSDQMCKIEEGCLSVPDIRADVLRPEEIDIVYYDLEAKKHTEKFSGLLARVAQHEIDHLNGILFVDRISPVKKMMLKKNLKKLAETSRSTNC